MNTEQIINNISNWLGLMGSDEVFGAIILFFILMFIFVFWRAQKSHNLDWTDLITGPGDDNSVSLTKVLQLIGGVVSTWIVIKLTIQGKIAYDIFGLYLMYVGSVEAYSKYVKAKYYNNQSGNISKPTPGEASLPASEEDEAEYDSNGKRVK